MIQPGTALKSTEEPYHRCVVISDPQSNGGQVVLVRFDYRPYIAPVKEYQADFNTKIPA
jgi:hypothetical protein